MKCVLHIFHILDSAVSDARELEAPTHAIFYSVNASHAALKGMDMATSLIKRTAAELQHLYPSITTFSTLSPIPGLIDWLKSTYCPEDASAWERGNYDKVCNVSIIVKSSYR